MHACKQECLDPSQVHFVDWAGQEDIQDRQMRSRAEPAPRELFDPYAPLDPHDPGNLPLRPFHKIKPRR